MEREEPLVVADVDVASTRQLREVEVLVALLEVGESKANPESELPPDVQE